MRPSFLRQTWQRDEDDDDEGSAVRVDATSSIDLVQLDKSGAAAVAEAVWDEEQWRAAGWRIRESSENGTAKGK